MPSNRNNPFGRLLDLFGGSVSKAKDTLSRFGIGGSSKKNTRTFKRTDLGKPTAKITSREAHSRDRKQAEKESPEEAREKQIKEDELADDFNRFMSGKFVSVSSSNVNAIAYFPESYYLEIEYHDGTYYGYFDVSSEEAANLFRSGSKGGWVWDHLRIRGTKLGFRKSYVWNGAVSRVQRKWDATQESSIAHGIEAQRQTDRAIAKELADSLRGSFGGRDED